MPSLFHSRIWQARIDYAEKVHADFLGWSATINDRYPVTVHLPKMTQALKKL